MRSPLLPLALALAAGCSGSDQGTIVGNPGGMTVAEAEALSFTRAEAIVTDFELWDCEEGLLDTVAVDATIDLLDPAQDYEIPGGTYCEIVALVESYEIDGGNGTDMTFELFIDTPLEISVASEASFRIEATPLLLQVSEEGWIDPLDLAVGNTVIDDIHPLYDDILLMTEQSSAMYIDSNEDGILDPEEEEAGALADGVDRFVEQDTGETNEPVNPRCGCQTGPASALWLAFPLMLLARRRR